MLPFANLSGDPAQAFFSDGLAEELRIALAQIPGLKVAGRVSSEKMRDSDDLASAAAQLGVAHLLTGSVRRSSATIRIGAQLVDGKTGADIWSQSYDQPAGDALAVQSSIASSVVAALGARLGAGGVRVGGTRNPAAQELFLKARSLGRLAPTDSSMAERLAIFDAAIALDPQYAEAHAGRSNMLNVLASRASDAGLRDAQRADAMASARRAVALAPASGFAHSVLARRLVDSLQVREAVAEAERALRLSPGDARVSVNAGVAVIGLIDPERGLAYSRQGVALDPLNSATFSALGQVMFSLRRYAELAEAARAVLDVTKGELGHQMTAEAMTSLGKYDAARRALQRVPREKDRLALSAIIEARAGNRLASNAALARLLSLDNATRDFALAEVQAQRGEVAEALASLDKAFASREPNMASILVNPWLDPIRQEPRFKALQNKIFPPEFVALAARGRKN